jgi:hypothetical protein
MEPVGVGGLSVFGRCSLTSPIDIGTSDWEKRPVPLRPLVEQYQDQGERDRRVPTFVFESLKSAASSECSCRQLLAESRLISISAACVRGACPPGRRRSAGTRGPGRGAIRRLPAGGSCTSRIQRRCCRGRQLCSRRPWCAGGRRLQRQRALGVRAAAARMQTGFCPRRCGPWPFQALWQPKSIPV